MEIFRPKLPGVRRRPAAPGGNGKNCCKERKIMVDFEFREHYTFDDLLKIVRILRHPGGCPWDMEQTHKSLRRCLVEETCEVLEAIDREDDTLLCEELGDVLLHIVFHASLAEDAGAFTMDDVADGICKKMIYRHPHVFGDTAVSGTGQVLANWETLKRVEKGQKSDTDTLEAVARTLPALWRAEKILKKAAAAGFTWPDISGAMEKLAEEQDELQRAVAEQSNVREELGDVLFAAAAVARFAGIDPEEALQEASDKYIARFSGVEQTAVSQGRRIADMTLSEMVQVWNRAKETERNKSNVQEENQNE